MNHEEKKKSVTLKYPFIKKKSKAWNSVAELLYSGLNTAFNRENFQVYLHIYIYNAGSGEESTGSTDSLKLGHSTTFEGQLWCAYWD